MNKDIVIKSSDEAVDLGRRSMMSRFGLAASLTLAAPVLMTISTSTLATHRNNNDNDKGQGRCESMGGEGGANANPNAIANTACPQSVNNDPPSVDDLSVDGLL